MNNPVTNKRPMGKMQELAVLGGAPAFLMRTGDEKPAKVQTAPKVPVAKTSRADAKAAKAKQAVANVVAELTKQKAPQLAIDIAKQDCEQFALNGESVETLVTYCLNAAESRAKKAEKPVKADKLGRAVKRLKKDQDEKAALAKAIASAPVTVLAPAVAAGAYSSPTEANTKTGIDAKRKAVGAKTAKKAKAPKKAKPGDPIKRGGKGLLVIEMLQRKGGATMAELSKATGWKPASMSSYVPAAQRAKFSLTFKESKDGTKTWFLGPKKHRSS